MLVGRLPGPDNRCPVTLKRQHETEKDARKHAKSLRKTRGPKTKPYLCRYCNFYHIGHWRKPEQRRNDHHWEQYRA